MRRRMKGLTVLEVAILSAIVLASAAYLASMMLQPKTFVSQPAVVAVYSAFVLGPQSTASGTKLTALQQCYQIANAMATDKLLASNKPIIIGNPNSAYAYAVVVEVFQSGSIKGVAIYQYGSKQLYALINGKVILPLGRYLICAFSNNYYPSAKIELVGAKGLCVSCYAR